MIRKRIGIFAFFVLLNSCDSTRPIRVNGNQSYKVKEANCGETNINAFWFDNFVSLHQTIIGSYDICPDSLKVVIVSENETVIKELSVRKKGHKMSTEFNVGHGELIQTTVFFNKVFDPARNRILILPCGYLKCNGRALIGDTIVIER